jgi:hypothetical protein
MAQYGLFRRFWLTRLSRPAGERRIYRHAIRRPPRRIIEIGVGTLARTMRLLELAGSLAGGEGLHYVGLDRFEGRTPDDPPGVTLKQAHQRLHGLARVQLVPGEIDSSLSRLCNHLGAFDMLVISADHERRQLDRCWFFIQRIVTADTVIFTETAGTGGGAWSIVPKSRVDELAAKTVLRRAA